MDNQILINNLGNKGENLLATNLTTDEKVLVKLKGNFGQGFVITSRRVWVVKWGLMTKNTFGGKCIAFDFVNITALQLEHSVFSPGIVKVLSAATQDNKQLSYWAMGNNKNNAIESDNAVTFAQDKKNLELFQEAVKLGRDMIAKAHLGQGNGAGTGELEQLEKLADLKEKGILTQDEFEAKKRQILGL